MRLTPWAKPIGVVHSPSKSSLFTTKNTDALFLPVLCGLFVVHLLLSAVLPPMEDEIYYWTWTKHLQASYFDHPPMVAYWIKASSLIFGDNIFGIRFFSCVFTFFTLWMVASLSKTRSLVTLFLFTPLVFFGGIVMTPDAPLMFFWALYLRWFAGLARRFTDWEVDPIYRAYHKTPVPWAFWLEGGVWLGLGMLSKYTMGLAAVCGFLALLVHYRMRSWLMGYVVHGLVALAFLVPLFSYNMDNQWAPLMFQWHRSLQGTGGEVSFGKFVLAQAAMVGILPLLCLPWILTSLRLLLETPATRVCFYFFLPPFLFFLYKATQMRLEANWGLVAYLAFWPLAERLYQTTSLSGLKRTLTGVGFASGWAVSLLLLVHLVHPLSAIAPDKDRVAKLYTNARLAKEIATTLETQTPADAKALPVLTGRYQWVSYLRFHKVPAQQIVPYGRPSHFTYEAPSPCAAKGAMVVLENEEIPDVLNCFPKRETIQEFPYVVRGQVLGKMAVVKMSRPDEGTP